MDSGSWAFPATVSRLLKAPIPGSYRRRDLEDDGFRSVAKYAVAAWKPIRAIEAA